MVRAAACGQIACPMSSEFATRTLFARLKVVIMVYIAAASVEISGVSSGNMAWTCAVNVSASTPKIWDLKRYASVIMEYQLYTLCLTI